MLKKDSLYFGMILGLIGPVFGLLGYYFWKFYPTFSIKDFLLYLGMEKHQISGIVSICLFVNAAVFTLYVNRRRDKTGRGIFVVTCLYALMTLLLKFLL